MRKAVVSGVFYPKEEEKLEKEIKKYLGIKKKNIKMAISPHAGYMFSGKLIGEIIGEIENKKDFILLGVNHSGIGKKISLSSEDFETPLGIVKNNIALGNNILNKLKKKKLDVEVNEEAHKREHSIEVQLPFLQESQKKFEIIPILLKDLNYEECIKIAEVLSEIVDEKICILISSDFTHYGANYGFTPFAQNSKSDNKEFIKNSLYELDNEVIFNILKLDSKKVYEKASKTTICGLYGITIATEIAKIKKFKGKEVDYYTSGDVIGDYENCVGYAGITFE